MGRRLNVSTPTVINTELVPLDESFYLDVDGQMEQWYYDNTEQYAPNRKVTPLLLVPVISAFDKDTSTSYTPTFNTTQWFANEWNETQGKYVETEITNQVDSGSADYVIQGNNLLVKKNVSYSHAVSIRCVATYIDPRDRGVTYAVEDSVNLTTNRTADVIFPEVDIISPSGRAYNPLVDDENSQYNFKGVTTNNPVQPLNTDVRRYSVDVDGTEEILNSGEAVAPIMDIRYGENLTSENQEFMYRQTAGGTLVGESVDKAYIERIKGNTVAWNQLIREEFVDMGLPSGKLWAKKNLDVTQPSGFAASEYQYECSFFSWGNTDGHNPSGTTFDYDFGSSSSGPYASTPGAALTSDIGVANDAARFNGGAPWRIPTSSEFAELLANCDFIDANGDVISGTNKLTTINGIVGIHLKSKNNGNKMFMAAAGYGYSNTLMEKVVTGHYWLSEIVTSSPYNAYTLRFVDSSINPSVSAPRFYGFAIRPILTPNLNIDGDGHKYYTSPTTGTAYDLTLIYGEGNEPTTVAQFEADYLRWFGKPLSYEEYDEGSLRPVLMQSIKTTGFNQWDEEWEEGYLGYYESNMGQPISDSNTWRCKNYIPITEGQTYYIKHHAVGTHYVWTYDSNKTGLTFITMNSGTNKVVIPSGVKYIKIADDGTTYNHDICINISNPSKNGTYEPYEEKVQGFDVTAIKGKLNGAGESVIIFPDGMKKAGDIQDEIFVEDGVVKAIKRVGSVDMGTLYWRATGADYPSFSSGSLDTLVKHPESNWVFANIITCKCPTTASQTAERNVGIGVTEAGTVRVTDPVLQYPDTTPAQFGEAMNGVMLYYELAEPQTYVLDPITDFVWYGIKNGQEVLADTLPWYVSGQGTDNLTVDAMYGEKINVVLRCKMMDGETLSPSKAYATLNWRTPDIETFVQSDNGGAVRSNTEDMTFDTIVNVNGDVLTDALKQKHLAFNWKIRKNNTSTEIDKGWGQRITIDASDLRNVKGSGSTLASTLVSNEVYLKGAYEEVTDNGEVVTDGGEVVYDRPVD